VQRIEQAFQAKLEEEPREQVRLIVRVAGDMPEASRRLGELGATVLRSFTLTKALAVACSASTALSILKEPWVQAIEEDRQVSTQEENAKGKEADGRGKHERD
jgi:hypothetical protein